MIIIGEVSLEYTGSELVTRVRVPQEGASLWGHQRPRARRGRAVMVEGELPRVLEAGRAMASATSTLCEMLSAAGASTGVESIPLF